MKSISRLFFALVILTMIVSMISCSAFAPGGGLNNNDGSFGGSEGGLSGGSGSGAPSINGDSKPEGPMGETGDIPGGDDYFEGGESSEPSAPEGDSEVSPAPPKDSPSYDEPSESPDTPDASPDEGEAPGESGGAEGGDADEVEPEPEEPETDNVVLPAGMITAGSWNDNDYYSMWTGLFAQGEDSNGKFYRYTESKYSWGFNSLQRVKVSVTNEGNPVAGAAVIASDVQGVALYSAVTDAQGNAYLFVDVSEGIVEVTSGDATATAEFSKDSRDLAVEIGDAGNKLNVIEIMLVVDVTGSMGDEIDFLKAELADVVRRIAANDSDTVIKLALLFYRDTEDKVPFDYYDFTDVTTDEGLSIQQSAINTQRATGGGDYPEAVDQALDMAVNQQWSTGATTKIIFHVLDAPAHKGSQYETKLVNATKNAAEKGIRICPIICSGASDDTEYTMREVAIYTGGTFIYVTDDSGIGGSHHDPNIPNATIELLNSMMVRLVKGYHTGTFDEPIYWKQDPNLSNG